MSATALPPLTRFEVRALLTHYRITGHTPPTDAQVDAWLHELRGHSAGECHAALTILQAQHHGRITPADVIDRIRIARTHPVTHRPVVPAQRRSGTTRERAAAARDRGIVAVYAAMGWPLSPDREEAMRARCPFCKADPGHGCGPLTRDRLGRRERRDRRTGLHPSRLDAARTGETAR
ncbi:hypothetical protein JOD54_001957 [Actinokineospora baliensis]|uniref:hypothetical protein n=1 Tax=Actinokineospora baliensis TaxID=547056 RepID=UPI00195B78FD|nr:hypothetical protein [Actinokineospora baliensis]MBM7771753.1 hypothetical protein [Actinokineospora baliensis]